MFKMISFVLPKNQVALKNVSGNSAENTRINRRALIQCSRNEE